PPTRFQARTGGTHRSPATLATSHTSPRFTVTPALGLASNLRTRALLRRLSRNRTMGTLRLRQVGWGMGLLTLGIALYGFAAQERSAGLVEADRLFEEKSYAGALKDYERLLQAGEVPGGRREEVQY